VYVVLEYSAGMTSDGIVTDFPELNVDHVRAVLKFAALREHRLAAPGVRPRFGHRLVTENSTRGEISHYQATRCSFRNAL
jgi:hypothetical protein